ncbi:F-box protein 47 [Paragonimus westermani]|uniref:F-box protein 47 n=1 Tax=Paragonimus westermani TaxID=34504 RepID=A0A5J4NUR6_9TREM|nr:F-box protein 47 [Paragonimus westermani]
MKRCSTFRDEVGRVAGKLRRSLSDPVCGTSNATLGMFGLLPLEVNYRAFSYLKIEDLIALGNSSAHMKLVVEIFVNARQCPDLTGFHHPHSILIDANSKSFIDVCGRHRKAGLLLKSLCAEKTFTECLQILDIHLSNHLCSMTPGNCHDHLDDSVKSRCPPRPPNKLPPEDSISCRLGFLRCPALHLYGHFLRAFTGDWPEHKAERLFDHLLHHCFKANFWHRLAELVCESPGRDSLSELVLRLFLRRVFLDPAALPRPLIISDLDRSTSSCQNPAGTCDISAALLSAPKGRIMWHTMCENTAADSEQLSACFGELGSVLQNMLETGAWSPDEALSILNEITVIPDEWLAENVACLLYTAGPRLASMLITQKATTGNLGELAVTLTSLCLVRVKIRATLSDFVGLVGEACRATERMDRRVFLDQLARAFQDVIVDLYETDEIEDRMDDFSTILRAQAEFMRALMARIYED